MGSMLVMIFVVSLIQFACTNQSATPDKQSNVRPQPEQSNQKQSSQNQSGRESALSDEEIATLNKTQSRIENTIESFGYKMIESTGGDSHRWGIFEKWEREQFVLQAKRIIKIKSTSPIDGRRDNDGHYYCRFAIWIEVYADEKKAQKRTEQIRDVPPGASAEDTEYFMAEGFSDRNIVYIVETDAVMFLDELGRFRKRLEKAIKEQQ